jgi:hypothetical protein
MAEVFKISKTKNMTVQDLITDSVGKHDTKTHELGFYHVEQFYHGVMAIASKVEDDCVA